MVATALLIFDIAILFWCSLEDLRSMEVDTRPLYLFVLVSLGYALYTGTFVNIVLAIALFLILKILPGYKIGLGDQYIFAGLAMQLDILPLLAIVIFSFGVANIFCKGREIPFIPVIFCVFIGLLWYTPLLGSINW
jgi:hypothetical protein